MVAVIKTGHSINRILNYNEQKVKEGVAQCIAASNYPKDVEDLTLDHKLNRLLHQAALNENVSRNSVHISLNFDPSEHLSCDRLVEIAAAYMQKIGFGEQPYLVYQHFDSGHPHVHIVSIKIRRDGSRIDTQNIGRNQSQKARKEIGHAYGLMRAEEGKQKQVNTLKPVSVERVQYGKNETRRAISSVVDFVVNHYKYTSLVELNAVLRQYNIVADRGSENSRIYQKNGLVYRVLDHQGNKKGVPIKASACDSKPTLKLLQEKFQQNERTRQQHAVRVKNAIDWALFKGQEHTFHSFLKSLEKEGIVAIWKQKGAGVSQDITYIDHTTKCVFSGIGLGLRYSAPGIQSRCRQVKQLQPEQNILEQKIKRVEEEVDPIGHTIKSSQVLASKMVNKTDSCKHASPVEDQSHQQNKTVKKKRNHISRHL